MYNITDFANMKKHCIILYIRLMLIVLILALPFMSVNAGHAAVTLIYFAAGGHDGFVVLTWETASEFDNVGFFIRRSLERDRGYLRVSDFIPTHGDDLIGGVYDYVDTEVINGVTYWYKLESIDDNQGPHIHEPPVSAIPGRPTIPTQAATQVIPTATNPPTTTTLPLVSAIPTRTRTFIPTGTSVLLGTLTTTSTSIPAIPSSTLSDPIQVTQEVTATATLIPVPEIVMEFPSTPASSQENQSDSEFAGTVEKIESTRPNRFVSPQIVLLAGLLLLWLVLGGLFVYSLRRLK